MGNPKIYKMMSREWIKPAVPKHRKIQDKIVNILTALNIQ